MKNKLSNNLLLKILSVVIAFVLWLIVVNINDPVRTSTIYNIPIEIENESKVTSIGLGQVYDVESPNNGTAMAVVTGVRSIVDNLKPSDFKATADFADVSSVGAIPVEIISKTYGDRITITRKTERMRINIEGLASETYEVDMVATGAPANGSTLGDMIASPNVVKIKAPISIIEQIARVVVEADVNGMSTNISDKADLKLYDVNNVEIEHANNENITISSPQIQISVTMLKTKEVGFNFSTNGEVAEGYRFTGIDYNPGTVFVKGLNRNLASFTEITIPSTEQLLDITDATANIEMEVDIRPYLPTGVELLNENESTVLVTLKVEPLRTKNIEINLDRIILDNMVEGKEVSYNMTDNPNATFLGLRSVLDETTLESIAPKVDMTGLENGTHHLNVVFDLSNGVSLLEPITVTVVLVDKIVTEGNTEVSTEESTEESTTTPETESTVQGSTEVQATIAIEVETTTGN
ncbi:MAG: hypothetical protein GX913_06475 [Clostridiales bacterium]|nr:hypothetical protein [Clostridiales bacterium]